MMDSVGDNEKIIEIPDVDKYDIVIVFSKEEIIEDNMEVVKYNKNILGFCPNLMIYKCKRKN